MRLLRREFLKISAAAPLLGQTAGTDRPSILLIVADDLAAWMLGAYGNKEFKTPRIDRLAAMGVRVRNAHAATPADSPSRATLLTGAIPAQHGIGESITGQDPPPAQFTQTPVLAELLSKAGYNCGFAGEWNLGDNAKPQRGFSSWHVNVSGKYRNPEMSRNGQVKQEQGYLSELVTASTVAFLEAQGTGKPFFAVASYLSPHHSEEEHPEKYARMYENVIFETVNFQSTAPTASQGKEFLENPVPHIRKVAASLSALDEQVGILLDSLQKKGQLENTLVVFTSTNGSLLGRHGLWGAGSASEPPNMYEEAIEVPMILGWFGRTPPGYIRRELLSTYDLFPTLCELTGVGLPAGRKYPGRSFGRQLFETVPGKDDDWPDRVYGHYRNVEMVKDRRYKLVLRDKGQGPGELYDLRNDPREFVNQYENSAYLVTRRKLTGEIEAWRKQYS